MTEAARDPGSWNSHSRRVSGGCTEATHLKRGWENLSRTADREEWRAPANSLRHYHCHHHNNDAHLTITLTMFVNSTTTITVSCNRTISDDLMEHL